MHEHVMKFNQGEYVIVVIVTGRPKFGDVLLILCLSRLLVSMILTGQEYPDENFLNIWLINFKEGDTTMLPMVVDSCNNHWFMTLTF